MEFDSIEQLRQYSKNRDISLQQRIDYANNAILLSKELAIDTTLLISQRFLSQIYLLERDHKSLKKVNFKILKLAKKLNDTSSIANANYILGYVYHEELKLDSAYFFYSKAVKQLEAIGNTQDFISVLDNMSSIQHSERDYIGGEINAIKAIKSLEKLPKTEENKRSLWSFYNLVGIISGELKDYEKALEYHNKAFNAINGHQSEYYYKIYSKNNIASIYRRNKNYRKAVELFKEILKDNSLKTNDSISYANIIANLGYSKFLNDDKNSKNISSLFQESYKLAKILNAKTAIMATSEYYSEYLIDRGDLDSAKYYGNLAYKLAKETNANDFIMKSLEVKSKINKDSARFFLTEYIKLSDSLINAERSIRNKFARIDYETESFKQQKEVVSRQNILLLVASSILAITLLLLYVIKTRREKIKELQLAQQQQQANEEIYNLMLSQQDKMDEARAVEKKRISQEIHDGILGRLFGVRLNLDNLNFVKTDDAMTSRSNYINELKEIEFDIRKVSHDLNTDFVSNSSFSDIINTLVETQCEAYGLAHSIAITKSINWDLISNKTKVHIYRITQESLQNIYKHAEASLVSITINEDNNSLSLTISDNGKGFENEKIKDGIGLKNIKSRVEEINATFHLKTIKNQGTTVEIEIPVN